MTSTLDTELSKLRSVTGTLDAPLEGKSVTTSADGNSVIFEGLAAGLGKDRGGDTITPEALEAALPGFMRNPTFLWYHKKGQVLGRVLEAKMVPAGLQIKARIDKPTAGESELTGVWQRLLAGTLRGLSIGGVFRRLPGGIIASMDLQEISLCPIPMNPSTLGRVVETKALPDAPADLDRELAALVSRRRRGLDRELAALRRRKS